MDLENKVSSLEKFALIIPSDFDKSLMRVQSHLSRISWATDIYPYYYDFEGKMTVPKCIFVPDCKVYRTMISAIASKPPDQTEAQFLLTFGLLENTN